MSDHRAAPAGKQRVMRFRRGPAGRADAADGRARRPTAADRRPCRYERGDEPDEYRHCMLVNAAAFLFVLGLIGTDLGLTETLADLRRNQDCALAGHRNCAPVHIGRERY